MWICGCWRAPVFSSKNPCHFSTPSTLCPWGTKRTTIVAACKNPKRTLQKVHRSIYGVRLESKPTFKDWNWRSRSSWSQLVVKLRVVRWQRKLGKDFWFMFVSKSSFLDLSRLRSRSSYSLLPWWNTSSGSSLDNLAHVPISWYSVRNCRTSFGANPGSRENIWPASTASRSWVTHSLETLSDLMSSLVKLAAIYSLLKISPWTWVTLLTSLPWKVVILNMSNSRWPA